MKLRESVIPICPPGVLVGSCAWMCHVKACGGWVAGNSTIQIAAAPSYRGRVTALWSTTFVGSTPVGATIIGAIGAGSPRLALVVGGAACGAAALTGAAIVARVRTRNSTPGGLTHSASLR
jgi:hypothetical protein